MAEEVEEEAEEEPAKEIKVETCKPDPRFPVTNQAKHCFTKYVEFHKYVLSQLSPLLLHGSHDPNRTSVCRALLGYLIGWHD